MEFANFSFSSERSENSSYRRRAPASARAVCLNSLRSLWMIALSFFCLGFLSTISNFANAYEIDNLTHRNELKKDALPYLDREVNRILVKAAKQANLDSPRYCNKQRVRMEILRWIRPDPVGQLEVWANFTDEFDLDRTPLKKSIYAEINFIDSPILWTVGIFSSMKLNGHIVGVDKIGHFFMQGLSYYDSVNDGKNLDTVLETEHLEDGLWGLDTSGVKSYADMAANYGGYKFWSSLTTGQNPYFKCKEGKGWINVRKFSWSDYVNAAWDEGLNCSEYRPSMTPKIIHQMQTLGIQCPVQPDACERISKIEKSEHFTSSACKTHVSALQYKSR